MIDPNKIFLVQPTAKVGFTCQKGRAHSWQPFVSLFSNRVGEGHEEESTTLDSRPCQAILVEWGMSEIFWIAVPM